ncbi:terminase small subunit [Paracoccus chinensis]|uniref:Phage DNA packaging protein, Nu1 subunit of terminase n=1 Tax=Paracoccus chinensis TaxID=525640 RepID=A0A1G9H923_9RHOB|nr:terminase small subunit [Paracoccus chinensis]SDL09345.1 Phage DNA packaging protein, Nu1 subunit of terminase [Paracoccus chinensis]
MRIVSELPLEGDRPVHRIDGAGLCDLLGLSPAALTNLKQRGIAVHHGRDAWNLEETVRNYVQHLRGTASGRGGEQHVESLTSERARLAKEQADAQSLKNAERRGELVSAASVLAGWSDTLRGLRARLMALPSRLRADLPHLSASDVALIDRELRSTLEALADGDD